MSATHEPPLPLRAMNQLSIIALLVVFALGFYQGERPSGCSRGSGGSQGEGGGGRSSSRERGEGQGSGRQRRRSTGPIHLLPDEEREPRRPTRQEVDEAFRQLSQATRFPSSDGHYGNVESQRVTLEENIRATIASILTEPWPGWRQQVVATFQRLDYTLNSQAVGLERYYRSFAGRRPGEMGRRDADELARLEQIMESTKLAWPQLEGLAVRRGFPEADLRQALAR